MTDRFTEAIKEMQEKSPFVCISCGHPHTIERLREKFAGKVDTAYHDRFTEATQEESEKNAFTCDSCGKHQTVEKEGLH